MINLVHLHRLSLSCLGMLVLCCGGCSRSSLDALTIDNIDLERMAYSALRQQDCLVNNPQQFCQRSFAEEFSEYEQLRREFLLQQADATTWLPVSHATITPPYSDARVVTP